VKALVITIRREGGQLFPRSAREVDFDGTFPALDGNQNERAFVYELLDKNNKPLFSGTRFDPTGARGEALLGGPVRGAEGQLSERREPASLAGMEGKEDSTDFELLAPAHAAAVSIAIYSRDMERRFGSERPVMGKALELPPIDAPAAPGGRDRSGKAGK
jgi:hypothetical protein